MWRSNTVSKLVQKKKPSTKNKTRSASAQPSVTHVPQQKAPIDYEITPEMSIQDFFALVEKKFGFQLYDLLPSFKAELIVTVGDLIDDPDWVNQVQMDKKYVEVITHCLEKAQDKKRTVSSPILPKKEILDPPPPPPESPEKTDRKDRMESIDDAAMLAPPPPPPAEPSDDKDDSPQTVTVNCSASEVKKWLAANGFDPVPFEGKNGEEFFKTSKSELKKIYGVATGVRLYNRRESS